MAALATAAVEAELLKRLQPNLQSAIVPSQAGKLYDQLIGKSKDRDTNNWHSYGLELEDDDFEPKNVHYLLGEQRKENGRVYLRYNKGQALINAVSSAALIKF